MSPPGLSWEKIEGGGDLSSPDDPSFVAWRCLRKKRGKTDWSKSLWGNRVVCFTRFWDEDCLALSPGLCYVSIARRPEILTDPRDLYSPGPLLGNPEKLP
ncbi:hypothetical protein JTE90_022870 [Oedothorax gibbosus]|uniref:Uncharacterized protein n=1 Tax=Oedothorax gibbosus TaxID=931172 RepID=A0AAV6TCV2_9ARAC|nr:hypothetical protein JTE90_022870 [Oedothorax gibbosus]